RPQSLPWSARDYDSYIDRRKYFFRSYVHSRAAITHGGILWRLALEELGFSELHGLACRGPDGYAVERGHDQRLFEWGRGGWCDDALSEDEEYCVIGGYKILVEERNQVINCSWWPKAETWNTCGLGKAGYWTHKAEEWYLKRQRDIREGKATVVSQGNWR
ncbi:hypothetical protein OE88DRAFT_1601917, partial [Heliocybe sulcata]